MPVKKTKAELEKELIQIIEGGWTRHYKERLIEASAVLGDPFPLLLKIVGTQTGASLHASWTLSSYGCLHLDIASKYVSELVDLTLEVKHDGIRKELMRLLRDLSPIADWETTLLDIAFAYLQHPNYSKAVHYYSLDIAYLTVMQFPELFNEYKVVVDETMRWGSKPYCAKAKRYDLKLTKKAASTV